MPNILCCAATLACLLVLTGAAVGNEEPAPARPCGCGGEPPALRPVPDAVSTPDDAVGTPDSEDAPLRPVPDPISSPDGGADPYGYGGEENDQCYDDDGKKIPTPCRIIATGEKICYRCDTNDNGHPDDCNFKCDSDNDNVRESCFKCDFNNNGHDEACLNFNRNPKTDDVLDSCLFGVITLYVDQPGAGGDNDVYEGNDMLIAAGAEDPDIGHTFWQIDLRGATAASVPAEFRAYLGKKRGFYPAGGIDMNAPVAGKLVDDGAGGTNHAWDAEITYAIKSHAGLVSALRFTKKANDAPDQYDLSNYNCTDCALKAAQAAGVTPPDPQGQIRHPDTNALLFSGSNPGMFGEAVVAAGGRRGGGGGTTNNKKWK